jgi:prevent-host-death family protein
LVPYQDLDTFNIHEAKAQFSKIMRRVEQGRAVLVARDGVVIARITPETTVRRIKLGRDEGKATIAADFDAPLEDFADYEPS